MYSKCPKIRWLQFIKCLYYEEVLLFQRCKCNKLKMVYAPNMEVWHKEGKSTDAKFRIEAILKKAKMAYDVEQIAIDSFDM